jgi:hypothetical protein
MTYKDPEFIAYFDSLLVSCLARICGPAAGHFCDPLSKLSTLMCMTNVDDRKLILASIRRLVRLGRVTRAKRCFAGRTVSGIVCLPRADWERLHNPPASILRLTDSDVTFLKFIGIAVDREDVCEPVLARP